MITMEVVGNHPGIGPEIKRSTSPPPVISALPFCNPAGGLYNLCATNSQFASDRRVSAVAAQQAVHSAPELVISTVARYSSVAACEPIARNCCEKGLTMDEDQAFSFAFCWVS